MPSAWGSLWRTSDIWGKSQSQIEENLKFCFTQGKIEEISKLRSELREISNFELRKLLYKRNWGNLKYFVEILKFEEISNLSSFIQSRPGAREESASPALLAASAMNARDTTKVYIWRLDTGCGPTLYRRCHSHNTPGKRHNYTWVEPLAGNCTTSSTRQREQVWQKCKVSICSR